MRRIKIIKRKRGYIVYCLKKDEFIPLTVCRSCRHYLGGAGSALFCSYGEEEGPIKIRTYGV